MCPMKIALDVRMMWSSGIGSYIRHLAPRVIRKLPEARFCLLGRPEEMKRWEGFAPGPNIEWVEVKARIFTLSEQMELARKIPRGTDLLWCPNYDFPLLWRGKLMVTVHDLFHLVMGKGMGSIPKWAYSHFMFDRLVHRADALLSVSQFTEGELIRLTRVSPRKIKVIHNGVDESWFKVERRQNPHSRPFLLFVGNVKPHKNLGRLLEAFAMIKDRVPHDLVLVGKKEGFITGDREVLRQAETFGDRVKFTGVLEDGQLQQYYAFADLLVFPSLYEGFGLPPLEAMAVGTPVACSHAASLPEVCGEAALYFDPSQPQDMADKISKILENRSLRDELVKRGLEWARPFSWDHAASQTVGVLEDLLKRD